MSHVPVLIPVQNEERHLARTLEGLPRDVDPVVILNGTTDGSGDIARRYAAQGLSVLESDPGKMVALQQGIRHLGSRATQPFITLDADSHPVLPRSWTGALLGARATLGADRPAVLVGGAIYRGSNTVAGNLTSTILEARRQHTARGDHGAGIFPGRNMLVHLTSPGIDMVAAAPNYWPGEDQFIADVAVATGGATLKVSGLRAAVWTDGERQPGFMSRFTMTSAQRRERMRGSYTASGIPGVTQPYSGR